MIFRSAILLITLAFSIPAYALNVDFYVTVAKESLDNGDYAKATEKCKKVFEEDPENADCKAIMKKIADHHKKTAQAAAAKQAEQKQEAEHEKAQEKAEAEKHRQLVASPEYNAKQACFCNTGQALIQSNISEEQQIGAVGGFVDKNKLHFYASLMVKVQKALHYYESKAGASFNLSSCPTPKKVSGVDPVGMCVNYAPSEAFE